MRRLAALATTIALAAIVVEEFRPGAANATLLAVGVALLAAVVAGWLCEFFRLPRITGYLTLGLICGPSFANIVSDTVARDLRALDGLVVVVVAMTAGLRFNLRLHRPSWAALTGLTAVTLTVTWVGLAAALYAVWPWLPGVGAATFVERLTAVVLAATLLSGASPAVAIAVIAEGRARGPLTSLSTEVVVLLEVAVLILFVVWQQAALAVVGATAMTSMAIVAAAVWSVVGSIAFGALCGALFTLYLQYIGREIAVVLIAFCAVLTGFADLLGVDPFLAGLSAGVVVQNVVPGVGDLLHDAMEYASMPILVLFFAVAGASIHTEAVVSAGVLAVAMTAWRVLCLRTGTIVGARLVGINVEDVGHLWRALVPGPNAALTLLAAVSLQMPEWAGRTEALVLAVVAITQFIGPILFRAALAEAGEIDPSERSVVVVSNREPWVHERLPDGSVRARPTPGGVSVALDALMRERGGTWFAHGAGSADHDVVDSTSSVEVPPDAPAYRLRRLFLSDRQVEGYYNGFANSALWPLCHQAHVRPLFRSEDWDVYQEVNERFADVVAAEAPAESLVFLNDYHLARAPRFLRTRRPRLRMAQFWHIPWPDVDRLRICPWRRELVDGLLANDLLAFQLARDQRNFLAAAVEECGASVSGDVAYLDRPVRVMAIPIGADFDRITGILAEERLGADMRRLREELALDGAVVGVGVDRLDYTKGIPERVAALARLFESRPDLAGIRFVQVGVPSRPDVPGYLEISREIDALVNEVNRRFGRPGEAGPIVQVKRALELPELVALYRLADFCVVSSLHDGMNLVAKEFVASRDDLDGVLVLSELAGASEELAESLIINPYDERGFAAAIARAIEMPEWERRRRMQALRRRVAGRDVLAWASDILDQLERGKGRGFLSG